LAIVREPHHRDLCHKDIYGLRLGYFLTPAWELEGAIERVGSDAATMVHVDALYHFMTEKSFNPFIIGGVGGAHVRRVKGDSYDTLMADIGVGFKYQLSEKIAFRTEIRDVNNALSECICYCRPDLYLRQKAL